jgi:vacuolar-type H+-ATPase subunit F/Vma7
MRNLLAVIGDQVITKTNINTKDTVTGLLLAGTGHITSDQRANFLIVDSSNNQTCNRLTG